MPWIINVRKLTNILKETCCSIERIHHTGLQFSSDAKEKKVK